MSFLFFDTETTGLDERNNDIIELAFVLCDASGTIVEQYSTLIKTVRVITNSDIHHITNEMTERDGIVIGDALVQFERAVRGADVVVAHNAEFDLKFVGSVAGATLKELLGEKRIACTKIMAQKYFEWKRSAKLVDVHQFLFGQRLPVVGQRLPVVGQRLPVVGQRLPVVGNVAPITFHRALADTIACKECYFELAKRMSEKN